MPLRNPGLGSGRCDPHLWPRVPFGFLTGSLAKISKAAAVAALAGGLCASAVIAQPAKESLRQLADKRGMLFGAAAGEAFNNDNAAFKAALAREFNTVVSEYSMKFGQVVPARGTYNWGPGDKLVDFAQQNKMKVRGHCLAWHKEASFLESTRMTRARCWRPSRITP